jgi:hypothetical protein
LGQLNSVNVEPGRETFRPRLHAVSRFFVWLGVRTLQIVIYLVLGWIVVGVTGRDVLEEGVGAFLGLGIFLALPLSLLGSAAAWGIGTISVHVTSRWARRSVLVIAVVIEFAATLFLFLAWTPNYLPVVIVEAALSGALTAVLLWAHKLVHRSAG